MAALLYSAAGAALHRLQKLSKHILYTTQPERILLSWRKANSTNTFFSALAVPLCRVYPQQSLLRRSRACHSISACDAPDASRQGNQYRRCPPGPWSSAIAMPSFSRLHIVSTTRASCHLFSCTLHTAT